MDIINIVFFSDTHLGFDYPLRPRVKKRRRGEDFFNNFEKVLAYARTHNCDMVIHGGDLFFRSKVPQMIVDRTYQILMHFANSGIPIFILPGNHERSRLPTSLFLNHPQIFVFNCPRIFIQSLNSIKIGIAGLPFIRNKVDQAFSAAIREIGWDHYRMDIKLLALHQAIEGATVGPEKFTFRKGEDTISLSTLPDDALAILCGHIHRQQILTKNNRNQIIPTPVIFSGSTERTSFAEKDENKGFYHLIFQKIEERWKLAEARFIRLPTRPMEDIYIDPDLPASLFRVILKEKIDRLDPNSIIRFRSGKILNENLNRLMTTKSLSQIIPESMNFTFSRHLYKQDI